MPLIPFGYFASIFEPSLALWILTCTQDRRPSYAVVSEFSLAKNYQSSTVPVAWHVQEINNRKLEFSQQLMAAHLRKWVVYLQKWCENWDSKCLWFQMMLCIIFQCHRGVFQATRFSGKWSGRWSPDKGSRQHWAYLRRLGAGSSILPCQWLMRPQLKRLATPQLQQSFQCFLVWRPLGEVLPNNVVISFGQKLM